MQYEYCSGAVLYTKVNNIINYILVVEIDGHCGFPKGHIEFCETEIQSALREIKEETGITANILDGFLNKIEYAMKNGNIKHQYITCTKTYGQEKSDLLLKLISLIAGVRSSPTSKRACHLF